MKKDQLNIDQKLLVLYLLDEISRQGRIDVEAWLDESSENRNHFVTLKKTWDETGKIDPASVAFDTGRAWSRMMDRIENEGAATSAPQGAGEGRRITMDNRVIRAIMSVAAIAILGLTSVLFVRFLQNRPGTGAVTYAALAEVIQDTLTDGSTIVLNSGTKLTVPKKFAKASRKVELAGEAFFQVKSDSAKPFIIQAELGQVKVLGTSFQVKAYPGSDLEVYVETGRVELSMTDSIGRDTVKMILKAGERGMIKKGGNGISRPEEIGPDELFWVNKKLIFQETKLSLVFNLLKKHYDADIEVSDPAILDCLLSAIFTDETIDQILEVVTASFDLEMSREKEKYVIKGKGCGNEEK